MPSLRPLTAIQREVLDHLAACELRAAHPTYRELAAHFGWKAVATARDHLQALSIKGFVSLSGGPSRNLRLTPQARALLRPAPLAGEGPKANPMDALAQDLVGLLAPYLKKKQFKAGTYLWHGGDPARRCIVIDHGRIMASRHLPSGPSDRPEREMKPR